MRTMHLVTVIFVTTALLLGVLYYVKNLKDNGVLDKSEIQIKTDVSVNLPTTYEECIIFDNKYVTHQNSFECVVKTTNNQTDDESTLLYRNCMAKQGFVDTTKDKCTWIGDKNIETVPKRLSCIKNGKQENVNIGKKGATCEVTSYNPKYLFPTNYENCLRDGGLKTDSIIGGSTCEISISEQNIVDRNSQSILNNRCIEAGGKVTRHLNRYTVCTALFEQNPGTPDTY